MNNLSQKKRQPHTRRCLDQLLAVPSGTILTYEALQNVWSGCTNKTSKLIQAAIEDGLLVSNGYREWRRV